MASELFKIGNNDYTTFITVPSYNVNKNKETVEWTDVTKTKHKEVVRSKLEGSFSMYFENLEDLDNFLDDVENNTTTGNYIHAFVYDNKSRTLVESDYFIDFELQNDRPYFRIKKQDPFTVNIEER